MQSIAFSSNFCHQPWASIDHAGVQTRANPSIGISPYRDTCRGGNASPTSFTWPLGMPWGFRDFTKISALGKGKIYNSGKGFHGLWMSANQWLRLAFCKTKGNKSCGFCVWSLLTTLRSFTGNAPEKLPFNPMPEAGIVWTFPTNFSGGFNSLFGSCRGVTNWCHPGRSLRTEHRTNDIHPFQAQVFEWLPEKWL